MALTDANGRSSDAQLTAKAIVNMLLSEVQKVEFPVKTATGEHEVRKLKEIKEALSKLEDKVDDHLKVISKNIATIASFFSKKWAKSAVAQGVTSPAAKAPTVAAAATGVMPGGGRGGKGGGGGKGIPLPSGGGMPGGGGVNRVLSSLTKASATLSLINVGLQGTFGLMATQLNNMGIGLGGIFQGLIHDTFNWRMEMASLVFSFEGTSAALDDVKKRYTDIGMIIRETGKSRTDFQKQYIKELGRGMTLELKDGKVQKRTQHDLQRTVKNTAALSSIIGSDFGQTVELFGEWNRHLGMTNNQLASVGRAMQEIQHSTGLSGDNLLAASKTANSIIKEVYRFSGISEKGVANIVKTTALGQKYGAEDAVKAISEALAGGIESLSKADPRLAAALFRSAGRSGIRPAEIQGGLLDNPQLTQKIFSGLVREASAYLKGKGLSGDVTQLTKELSLLQKKDADLALRIKNDLRMGGVAGGLGAGGIEQLAKVAKEMGTTPEQRLEALRSQRRGVSGAGSAAVLKRIDDEIQKIESGMRREKLSDFMTALQTSGGNFSKALGGANLTEQGIKEVTSGVLEDLGVRAKGVNLDLTKELQARGVGGVEEMQRGLLGPNARAFNEILQEIENTLGLEERAKTDPLLEMKRLMGKANDYLRKLAEFFTADVGFKAMMAIISGMAALQVMSTAGGVLNAASLLRFLPGIGGMGAGAGVAGTAGGAGAAAGGGLLSMLTGVGEVALIAEAFIGAVGGVVQGFQSGEKAAELLGVAQNKLTLRQQQAAEGAGVLSGALNWMTFGIFKKSLGPTGTLTKKLAHLFDEFWPLGTLFGSIITGAKAVWGTIKGLWEFIKEVAFGLWDGIKTALEPLIDAGKEIWAAIGEPIKELLNVFSPFDNVMADSVDVVKEITAFFKSMGRELGDSFRMAGKVMAWLLKTILPPIVDMFRILGGVISAVTPNLIQMKDILAAFFSGDWGDMMTKLKDGMINAISEVIQWVKNSLNPFQGGIAEKGSEIWSGVKESGANVLSKMNPFNWFEEGTRLVERTGLGVLHKNEAVVPADQVRDIENFIAQGTGPFGQFNSLDKALSGSARGSAGALNMGAFSNDSVHEAQIFAGLIHEEVANPVVHILSRILDVLGGSRGRASSANLGAFDPGVVGEAFQQGDVVNQAKMMFERTFGGEEGSVASRIVRTVGEEFDKAASLIFGHGKGSANAFNSLDYGGETGGAIGSLANAFSAVFMPKGSAATSIFPADEAEAYIASRVEGGKPSGGNAMIPGMDNIFGYLSGSHDKKLQELIDLMGEIKSVLTREGPSPVLAASGGSRMGRNTGIKRWSKGRITGQWVGEQDSAYQPQANVGGDYFT